MEKKIRVAILFGGKSAEHEVSLQSAKSIIDAIDKEKYEVILVGIDKQGRWLLNNSTNYLINADNPKLVKLNASHTDLTLLPGNQEKQLVTLSEKAPLEKIDVVFPVLHGPFGEDGSMQGLLKILDVPFVGPGVLGSAVSMDKDIAKRLLRDADIPTAQCIVVHKHTTMTFEEVEKVLGMPVFIKPANLGSSVGVSKASTKEAFDRAVDEAFQFDTKILIEEAIKGREIECAVLGNENPQASLPGEIIPQHEFYSYDAKYIDEHGALLKIPADLSKEMGEKVQALAVKTFQILCCEGMARVDFFLTEDGKLYVNEVNTIPGFTKISMYPKLWEASGILYTQLIDTLITLAIQRHERDKNLKTTFS